MSRQAPEMRRAGFPAGGGPRLEGINPRSCDLAEVYVAFQVQRRAAVREENPGETEEGAVS